MIKVLHMFTSLDNGGVESFLYNYYSNFDHNKIKFDFIVPNEKVGFLEEELKKMNSTVYHLRNCSKNPFLNYKEINDIIKYNNYDIVHAHGYRAVLGLILAKRNKIRVRIMHSHMAFEQEDLLQRFKRFLITFLINIYATNKLACGKDAAIWLYGKNDYKKNKILVVNNAICLEKYYFNEEYRKEIRNEFNLSDDIILISNIARLTQQKNQIFILKMILKLKDKNSKFKVMFVGEGEDRPFLEQFVRDNNLTDYVIFTGVRKDVNKILSATDIFVLPSLYEGLPVVLAEVQASGVKAFVSDNITKEIAVLPNLEYLSIKDVDIWIEKVLNFNDKTNRKKMCEKMINSKYDIASESSKLFNYYISNLSNVNKIRGRMNGK